MKEQEPKLVHIHIDPLKAFSDVPMSALLDACGYVPGWVVSDSHLHLPLQEALDAQYNFGLFEMTGGTVTPQGIFQYPSDPDLYPFVKINRGDEIFYMYRSAIVAIIDEKGETFMTRMD